MYSIIDSNWHMVTSGSAGTSGATTELDNLGTTSINADLLPQANKNLGSAGSKWDSLHTDEIRLYSSTTSSTKTLQGWVRFYIGGSNRYLAYYN